MANIRRLFSIDLRSLALLRIGLGLMLLYDFLVFRWPNAEMMLSDDGVLPRALFAQIYDSSYWSLLLWNGQSRFVHLLLLLEGAAAICYMLGHRTRWANLICLVLVWSIQVRNPLTNTGGDVLLRVLLAWTCLLPMGATFGVDAMRAARAGKAPTRHCHFSIATIGLILQVVVMYFFAGVAKCNDYWFQGEALAYCLQFELFVQPTGYWLQEQAWALPWITWSTLWLELTCPVLLLSPYRMEMARGIMMALYWSMHLGIWLVYSIGIFSFTAMVSWFVFLPSSLWDPGRETDEESPATTLDWGRSANWLGSLMLAFMLAINVANTPWLDSVPRLRGSLHELGRWTMFVQEFNMFAEPPKHNSYFVLEAELVDGSRVDLFTHRQPNHLPNRQEVYRWGKSQPWRRYWSNLVVPRGHEISLEGRKAFESLRHRIFDRLLRQWNETHAPRQQVAAATLTGYYREIGANGSSPPEPEVWASTLRAKD